MPDNPEFPKVTPAQMQVLVALTDQRCAHILLAADVIGDMNADGLEVLRRLGDPKYAYLANLLRNIKPKTAEFLTEARDVEVSDMENGIELVRAFKTTGRFAKWAIISLGTMLGAVIVIKTFFTGGKS